VHVEAREPPERGGKVDAPCAVVPRVTAGGSRADDDVVEAGDQGRTAW
jgi:hypothetical protein